MENLTSGTFKVVKIDDNVYVLDCFFGPEDRNRNRLNSLGIFAGVGSGRPQWFKTQEEAEHALSEFLFERKLLEDGQPIKTIIADYISPPAGGGF